MHFLAGNGKHTQLRVISRVYSKFRSLAVLNIEVLIKRCKLADCSLGQIQEQLAPVFINQLVNSPSYQLEKCLSGGASMKGKRGKERKKEKKGRGKKLKGE